MKKESGPKKINALFERYKKVLKAPEQSVIDTVTAVIEELCDIAVPAGCITYSPATKTIHIKNGMIRSLVLTRQTEILNHTKGRLGLASAPKAIN